MILTKETARVQDPIETATYLFKSDADDDLDTAEVEAEDWIKDIIRNTRDAEDKRRAAHIPCWIETQRKGKWRVAMRIASLSEARWRKKQQHGILVSVDCMAHFCATIL